MDRKVIIIIFILLDSFLATASCLVELSKDKQIFLNGKGYEYIVVLPSNKANKKIKKYQLKNSMSTLVKVITEQNRTSENSTGDIVKLILESQRPVVVLAEEKAAADVLEAFLQYPNLKDKVKCYFSINGYIRGAQYAELAEKPIGFYELERANKIALLDAFELLIKFGTSFFSKIDSTKYSFKPNVRSQYLLNHDKEISELAKSIQLYSIDNSNKSYGLIPYSVVISDDLNFKTKSF